MHSVWKVKSPSTVLLKKPVLYNFLNTQFHTKKKILQINIIWFKESMK